MANICDITGKGVRFGNRVSKANNKTRRKFQPNLQKKHFYLKEINGWVALKVSTKAMRTIGKNGLYPTMKKALQKGTLSPKVADLLSFI